MKRSIRLRWIMALAGLTALPAMIQAQAAAKVDVTGKWTFSVQSEAGTGTPTLTFTQKGDSITGTYSSQVFGEQGLKGIVKDGKISFTIAAAAQGQSISITYSGTIDSADAMKGNVDFGGFGGGTFTGTRQKP
jgi:hypothetical protein